MRYVFVTGGVMSGLGKGVVASSLGALLSASGFSVSMMKIDPYLNVDAGTMNPYRHGEVFVTDDGGETDLDLGTYERFLDVLMHKSNNLTTGMVYKEVIERERRGDYLGECVQVIPHVTNTIKEKIRSVAEGSGADFFIVEVGGTVGDIEGLPFLEALRQMKLDTDGDSFFVHVAYVPYLETTGESKTKPAQHSVQSLREIGIQPDLLVARSPRPIGEDEKAKLALFSSLPERMVIAVPDLPSIYGVPYFLEAQGVRELVLGKFGLKPRVAGTCRPLAQRFEGLPIGPSVALVGKYVKLKDSYVSIVEALRHAFAALGYRPNLVWVDSEEVERRGEVPELDGVSGFMVLPGFGKRGSEGMVTAIYEGRRRRLPFLGICFGMQLAVVEYAREKLGYLSANSTELDPETDYPVIDLLPEQKSVKELGGTMRLGGATIRLVRGTKLFDAYGGVDPRERHRHRYEVNPAYWDALRSAGLVFSAYDEEGKRIEAVEDPSLPFFVGTQFHPEFNSRPLRPSPPYLAFAMAVLKFSGVTPSGVEGQPRGTLAQQLRRAH